MAVSFTKAINEFFGKKPGQTTTEFMQEIKALSAADRSYFKQEFAKIGIEVE
jgi:chitinase